VIFFTAIDLKPAGSVLEPFKIKWMKVSVIFFLLAWSSHLLCQPLGKTGPDNFSQIVEKDRKVAQTWRYSWIGGYTLATCVQGVASLTSNEKSFRQDMALGAATTFLGAVGALITPIVPGKSDLLKYGFSPDDTAHSQAYYELMLREIGRRERAGRSWKVHAVAGIVDLGSGVITWLGFKRTALDGLINFGINTVIAEAQIWSQPMKAAKDYDRYCAGKTGMTKKKHDARMYLGSYPGGVTIRVVF
jgi:hypothetical protein